ncbi:TetR/AcrR family transcriptional regulator [Larkinella humicola]|uniref:TetR/AcrR family transcriptional regulator n=1 Tax=Larkinella humicola TaxID=2607654 RepID=A0A5N1JA16_9BACT|nr:TetR/AcrR family transcriptional regulator [Larkinella humicola]KAA9347177.1 TetR/AcrR family transcriptional regulator [Larkinella humicola]
MKFTPRSEATRQFIIETAAGIFNKKGYAGTSLSDLTEATRLTKGSIYGNFENKEDVALAVFNFNAARRNKLVRDRLSRAARPKEKLLAFIDLFSRDEIQHFPEGGCPLLNAGVEADDTHEPLRQRVAEELIETQTELASIVRMGIQANEFQADTDAEKAAVALVALIQGGIFIARTTQNPFYLDTVLETARKMVHDIETKSTP